MEKNKNYFIAGAIVAIMLDDFAIIDNNSIDKKEKQKKLDLISKKDDDITIAPDHYDCC